MTSKLVVNTIEADTGISSVSFASSISLSSTSKFFFSDTGIDIGADTNINRPASGVLGFNINSSEKGRIDSSGRLLLGTTTAGFSTADDLTIATSGSTGITIRTGTTNQGNIYFADGTSGATQYAGLISYNHNTNHMFFGTNDGTERLRINSSGQLIMTNAATQTFFDFSTTNNSTRGLFSIAGKDGSGNAVTVKLGGFGDTGRGEIFTHSNHGLGFATNNAATQMVLGTNGCLSIGKTGSAGKAIEIYQASYAALRIQNSSTGTGSSDGILIEAAGSDALFWNYESANIRLATAGTERFRIDSSGNIIIGSGGSWQYPKALNVQGASGSIISIYNANTTSYAADTNSSIELKLLTGNTGNQTAACEIRGFKENGTNGDSARGISFWTGGNGGSNAERLRISSAGYVTTPAQPKFWAKSNNAQTLNGDGTNYIKNYQNEIYDIGNCYDGTNKFTAPITGYYHFGWSFMIQGGNTNGFTYLFGAPLISGNDIAQEVMAPRSGGANYMSLVGSHLLYLTSGQYVQIRMRQSGGNPVSVRSDQCYFWGYLVS